LGGGNLLLTCPGKEGQEDRSTGGQEDRRIRSTPLLGKEK